MRRHSTLPHTIYSNTNPQILPCSLSESAHIQLRLTEWRQEAFMVLEGRGYEEYMVYLRPGVPPPACLVRVRLVLLPRRLEDLVHMGLGCSSELKQR